MCVRVDDVTRTVTCVEEAVGARAQPASWPSANFLRSTKIGEVLAGVCETLSGVLEGERLLRECL